MATKTVTVTVCDRCGKEINRSAIKSDSRRVCHNFYIGPENCIEVNLAHYANGLGKPETDLCRDCTIEFLKEIVKTFEYIKTKKENDK